MGFKKGNKASTGRHEEMKKIKDIRPVCIGGNFATTKKAYEDEVAKAICENIEEHLDQHSDVLRKAFHQAMICGEVTLRIDEDGSLKIVNPFKGCGC